MISKHGGRLKMKCYSHFGGCSCKYVVESENMIRGSRQLSQRALWDGKEKITLTHEYIVPFKQTDLD